MYERLSLKMKGKVYQVSVRSAILYGSETWCLRKREVELLRRTKRALIRAMCGVKLRDRKNTKELMQMLGVALPIQRMVRAAAVR